MATIACNFASRDLTSNMPGGSDYNTTTPFLRQTVREIPTNLSANAKCPVGTPTWFLQVCRLASCRPSISSQHRACVGKQPETAWLYELALKTQLSHTTLVTALYYLSLIILQSLQAGDMVAACSKSTALKLSDSVTSWNEQDDLHEQHEPQQGPIDNNALATMMRQAVDCPHCLLTGCIVVATKALQFPLQQDVQKSLPSTIAQAASVPVEIVQFCELLIIDRLQHRMVIAVPVMDQLMALYIHDPIRRHWWESENQSCQCVQTHAEHSLAYDDSINSNGMMTEYDYFSLLSQLSQLSTS